MPFILLFFILGGYSCSCLPVSKRLLGKYTLTQTTTQSNNIPNTDDDDYIEFSLKWNGTVNVTIESIYENGVLVERNEWVLTEDFCRKDKLIVTYDNADRRTFSNVDGNSFLLTDFYTNDQEKADAAVFEYVLIEN